MTQVIDFAKVGMILLYNESGINSKSQFSGESWMGNVLKQANCINKRINS